MLPTLISSGPAHAFTASPIPKLLCFTLQSFGSVLGRSLAAHDFQIILDSEEWIKKKKDIRSWDLCEESALWWPHEGVAVRNEIIIFEN